MITAALADDHPRRAVRPPRRRLRGRTRPPEPPDPERHTSSGAPARIGWSAGAAAIPCRSPAARGVRRNSLWDAKASGRRLGAALPLDLVVHDAAEHFAPARMRDGEGLGLAGDRAGDIHRQEPPNRPIDPAAGGGGGGGAGGVRPDMGRDSPFLDGHGFDGVVGETGRRSRRPATEHRSARPGRVAASSRCRNKGEVRPGQSRRRRPWNGPDAERRSARADCRRRRTCRRVPTIKAGLAARRPPPDDAPHRPGRCRRSGSPSRSPRGQAGFGWLRRCT